MVGASSGQSSGCMTCMGAFATCGPIAVRNAWMRRPPAAMRASTAWAAGSGSKANLRLWPQAGRKQRELAATGANIDGAREISPGECARVLDGCGDTVAQARTKAAIGQEAQQLARPAHSSAADRRPPVAGVLWNAALRRRAFLCVAMPSSKRAGDHTRQRQRLAEAGFRADYP